MQPLIIGIMVWICLEVPRLHPRLFVVHGGCVFLVSGVTSAGDPVAEVEELHVSVTEGITEWGVVSEVDTEMKGNVTWAPGLCPEDRCSRDNSSEIQTTVIRHDEADREDGGHSGDISNLSRTLNKYEVLTKTASSFLESDINFEHSEDKRTREEPRELTDNAEVSEKSELELKSHSTQTTGAHRHGVTSSSPAPALVFSLGPDAAGQDSLIFSVKSEHEYVTTTSSSSAEISFTLFPEHESTDNQEKEA